VSRIPVLVVGDAPNLASGLARIKRDILTGLWNAKDRLNIDVADLSFDYDDSPWPWPVSAVHDGENWAERDIIPAWTRYFGTRKGAIFTIWDPARCFGLASRAQELPVQLWGYFALDAVDATGGISGPAAATVRKYRRPLAYGRWGAQVLGRPFGNVTAYLPHGISTEVFYDKKLDRVLIGAVAANNPRKDFGLLFETWARMRDMRPELKFWLHTNSAVGPAWSVPELVEQFGLKTALILTGTEEALDDETLATLYSQCLATIGPGLGEGFGYPVVESLACGAPVVGVDYAGAAELIPRGDWRVAASGWRYESVHVLKRPVVSAQALANATLAAATVDQETRNYCRASVTHLDWKALWPRWEAQIALWLQELR